MDTETKATHTPWESQGMTLGEPDKGLYCKMFVGGYCAGKLSLSVAQSAADAWNWRGDALAALVECRAEITRINEAAGETVFNPAATGMVGSAIAKARGEA